MCFSIDPNLYNAMPASPPTVEQELQLHLGVLQQHAALMIGGATATPCPICHKVVFGGEALVEHMKNTHKDPNASGVASKFPNGWFGFSKFEKGITLEYDVPFSFGCVVLYKLVGESSLLWNVLFLNNYFLN